MKTTIDLVNSSRNTDDYEFGYSTVNDILSVDNWQDSNDFRDVPNGEYWFFARYRANHNRFFVERKKVYCVDGVQGCTIEIKGGVLVQTDCTITITGGVLVVDSEEEEFGGIGILGKII